MIKLTNDKAAVVDTKSKWIPIHVMLPPRGAKVLVINKARGSATLTNWQPGEDWDFWHPLPTFLVDGDDD
jgi:hypothetical protein